jgi:hypothetical protein
VAEDVREGLPAEIVLRRLRDMDEEFSEAAEIVAAMGLEEAKEGA